MWSFAVGPPSRVSSLKNSVESLVSDGLPEGSKYLLTPETTLQPQVSAWSQLQAVRICAFQISKESAAFLPGAAKPRHCRASQSWDEQGFPKPFLPC